MSRRIAAAALCLTLAAPLAGAQDVGLTREQFKMYRYWTNALSHPEVQKMPEAKRLKAVARDGRFKPQALEAAIAAGEAAGDLDAKCEANIRSALAGGPLASTLGKLDADLADGHAVLYVQWKNADLTQVEEEAALAAHAAATGCPIATTIQVWATDAATPTRRVFQALIGVDRAARFKPSDVADFADTRYLRAFEQVKNAGQGDDLGTETGDPTPPPKPAGAK